MSRNEGESNDSRLLAAQRDQVLKQARQYRFLSRTMMPIYALCIAGHVVGHALYLGSGHLGLLWGPWGELRRAFMEAHPVRILPPSDWVDWAAVLLCAAFFRAELARPRHRGASDNRLLLVGYLLATLGAASVFLPADHAQNVYAVAAVLAASALTLARWRTWTRGVRLSAVGAAVVSAGISMALLRLNDLSLLGRMRW